MQGKEVMIYVDDQVRDLGEQTKKNGTSIPHRCANPNAKKTPTVNISLPREQEVKVSITVPTEQILKKKTKKAPKPTQTKVNKRYCLRSATGVGCTKGQKKSQGSKIPVMLLSSDEDSSNSYENSEDEPYKPVRKDNSSDSCVGDPIPSCKLKSRKKTTKKVMNKGKSKDKEQIYVDDDAFVEDVEVDLRFMGGGRTDNYDTYDSGTDSNGISCVHACAAIAKVNKHPEDFYHKLLTMELYKVTYSYHINPLPGQQLWKRFENNRPLAPLVKRKSGQLQTKRKKDANEGGHSQTKRGCQKKRDADAAEATAVAAAAAKVVEAAAKDPKNVA
ncbi:hypothetical protein Ahy_B05g079636 [Arachis hypogaea]|uniref:Uncharacterized protein n=1 Tax=Arachis hypogaea TaxID=3818 RepID=A0A444ZAE1_ARAHY|nr:hypothetical protein Ahy_B05g079636 [Arachis hypogaea]